MIRAGQAAFAVAPLVVLLLSHSSRGLAAPKSPQKVSNNNADSQATFNRDIAPIMFHYCASCHRPGESGPFPLLSYKDAKSHARQIAAVTRSRFMPPAPAGPGA